MKHYFAPHFFDGYHLLEDVLFAVEDGVMQTILPHSQQGQADLLHGLVCPGFIDLQVNGGGGVQFNNAPSTDSLITLARAHANAGTTSLMPTLITDGLDVMQDAAQAFAKARAVDPTTFIGLHFEGPHLSQAKKGMHENQHIRGLSQAEIDLFCRDDLGQVVVTLAPETVPPEQIQQLCQAGVIVSLGHTNATFDQAMSAFNAGARCATHLYNAMSAMTSREPGVVGATLYNKDIYCGLIVDNHHVHPASAALAIRLKGADKVCLVTDAMAPAASTIDHFYYQGVRVNKQDNTLRLEDGTLAGSLLTMIEAVQNTHQVVGISLEDTLKMATTTPAHCVGNTTIGALKQGNVANFLLLDENLGIKARWQQGKPGTMDYS